ncbi:DNA recombination protein RmuC [Enhydrobacter sp.]|jgi:DNA recombination protein RmuC|uniref:DNA recombination protein RmuC n=1 Tax=Enhydrobacter sp. TaxID=1894999 RepID=UPI0026373485|nr:DNA recombination protein RmuC [Enhydrobacter sp.]WIM11128.1 MAG: DNA recombination protein RmuC [Enhydrobacter sp.]
MDILLYAFLALIALLLVGLIVLLLRRGDNRETQAVRQHLEMALSQQAETVQRVERSLREQEQALSKVVSERLDRSEKATGQVVTDLRERLARIDEAQRKIGELSTQVVGLQEILSNKQARGAFGEVQLNDLVQSALPPSAYEFQCSLGNGARVDCLLRLPNPPGSIAIDAKFPLESYRLLRGVTPGDSPGLATAQRAFQQAMRKHIGDIRDKYIVAGETAESALLFLPSEAIYAELHANFATVVEESYKARVWIVSPTTLMATLNTVRAVLKDVRMREQAGEIQKAVGLMLDDVRRLDERVTKLKTHFTQTEKDLRDIETSTERITKRGERILDTELGDAPAPLPPKV